MRAVDADPVRGYTEARDRDALVFVAPSPPFPANSGAPIRARRLLDGLARAFEVTLVTFEEHPFSGAPYVSAAELQEALPHLRVVGLSSEGPPARSEALSARARGILSPHSSALRPYMDDVFIHAIHDAIRRTRAAVVHFDFHMIGGLGPIPGAINVYAPHNIEHRIRRAAARHVRGRRRVWAELDWRKLRRDERAVWRQMDLCLAVSELDATEMRSVGPRRVEICPNGTDPVEQLPAPRRRPGDPIKLVFVGRGTYPPNERGLRWLVGEVLPRVRGQADVELDVVGKRPVEPREAEGVRYLGPVPSVAPWYARSHVVVVPVFEGSGTRLKIPEALAHGRPVVSTSLGAEGLPVRPGLHYLQADGAEEFARAILKLGRLCEHPDEDFMLLLDRGRGAVQELMWPSIAERLARRYHIEIRQRYRSKHPLPWGSTGPASYSATQESARL